MLHAAKRNVFSPANGNSLRLELALLALPLLALGALFLLLPAREHLFVPKVTLRVTSAKPSPEPQLARDQQLAREHVAFALSKIARPLPVVVAALPPEAPAATRTQAGSQNHVAPVRVAHAAAIRRHRSKSIQAERKARIRSAERKAHPAVAANVMRRPAQPEDGSWLKRLKTPVSTAMSALAPVTDSVARTVERAGGALETIRRKVL